MCIIKDNEFRIGTLHHFGLCVLATSQSTLFSIDSHLILDWLSQYKFILLRGFDRLTKDQFLNYAKSLGQVLEWEFGSVMEMKVKEDPKNYLFTNSAVPFHWDAPSIKSQNIYSSTVFRAPLKNSGGETLSADTEAVYKLASSGEQALWKTLTLSHQILKNYRTMVVRLRLL